MTKMTEENKNVKNFPNYGSVPKLRFSEFKDKWENKKLGELMTFKVTNSYSRDNLNYESGTVKNVHYGDIHTKFQTLFDLGKENVPYINEDIPLNRISEDFYCQEGDIIFADASEDLNDVGKSIEITNLNGEKLLSGLHTLLARPQKNNFSKGFLGYLFKSDFVRNQIKREAQGSKVLSINVGRISNINLSFPSISEQRKISEFLSLLDKRILCSMKIIEDTRKMKLKLSHNLFTQNFRINQQYISKWEEKTLGDISAILMGQSPDSSAYNTDEKGLPLIQGNADIVQRFSQPRQFTTQITKTCDIGDIILTVRAPVGYVAKSKHFACIGRGVCAIKSSEKSDSEFIYQFLLYFENKWSSFEQGSTFASVNSSDIKTIKINVPTIEEQREIAQFLKTFDEKINIEAELLAQYENQKKYLLQNLFI